MNNYFYCQERWKRLLYTVYTTCQIRHVQVRYQQARPPTFCAIGGANVKKTRNILTAFFLVGLRKYFEWFTESENLRQRSGVSTLFPGFCLRRLLE